MSQFHPAAMPADDWRCRLAALTRACCDLVASPAEAAEHDLLLREGHALMRAAPACEIDRIGPMPTLGEFEVLLRAGARTSAALSLVPEEAGYLISRGETGTHLASVVLAGFDEEIAAEARSPALALLAALAGALSRDPGLREIYVELEADEEDDEPGVGAIVDARRLAETPAEAQAARLKHWRPTGLPN